MKKQPGFRHGSGRQRLIALVATAVMLAGLAPLASPSPARAVVLDPPTLTAPGSGSTVTGNPVFAWSVVSGAAKYRIQISSSPAFTSPVAADTQNLRFSPPTELPLGTLYWRVAALDSGNVLGTYATGTFEKAWGASPEAISPPITDPTDPDGVVSLAFPTEPLLFTWKALAGAQSYELQVDDADDFIGATTYKTKNTSYVITEPRTVGQTFYWQLRGVSGGNYSDWSAFGKFRSTWATKPMLEYPEPDDPVDPSDFVTDLYFDWAPVLGAKTYQLQVSPNGDWTNNKTIDVTVKSTRYVPPVPLNNGNYFWRVRALDAASTANFGPWSDPGRIFQRGWPDKPMLVWPSDGGSTADANAADPTWQNPTFTWTAIRRASWYRVRIGTEKNGTTGLLDGSIQGCITNRTTLTPNVRFASPGICRFLLTPGETYYWDVAGIDSPVLNPSASDLWGPPDQKSNVLGLRSDVRSFVWQPPEPLPGTIRPLDPSDYLTPATCAPQDDCTDYETDTPVLTWTAIPGATAYRITLSLDPNFTNIYATYCAEFNRFAGTVSWRDNQANEAYYWNVTPDIDCGAPPTIDPTNRSAFQKRSVPVYRTAPVQNSVGENDFEFRWDHYLDTNLSYPEPVTTQPPTQEAKQYRITVSTVSDFATTIDTKIVNTPFYTPYDRTYPEGPIYWRVQAIDGSGNDLTWSRRGTGMAEFDPDFAGVVMKKSPVPTQFYPGNAATVKGVPYLQWLPLAYAASYDVQIDNDVNFSSPAATVSATKMSAWAYTEPLAAGTYYWRVRRNDADNRDGAWSSVRSFVLAPAAPTLVSPANGTFPSPATLLLQWTTAQPAPSYQVEVSTSETFTSFVSGYPQTTVMTSWAPKTFFANGTYYWRVKSRNASGTSVATSSVFSFKVGEKTPFTDISSSPFKPDIEWVYLEGITSGCTATTYCPDGYVTREQMASFLARALHLSGAAPDAFTDDETSIHEVNINLVAQAGIASGCSPSKFCPTGLVTREQMASFLARALHLSGAAPDAFTDDETSIHEVNINLVAREGIATGCGNNKYCPAANVTRGQMAAFLHRAFGP